MKTKIWDPADRLDTPEAEAAGLSRESLYRALSDTGNPSLTTVLAVVKALGLVLTAKAAEEKAA